MNIINRIALKLNISQQQVTATVNLIDEGNSIPFIARYRKEVTNNLDDSQLRDLFDELTYLRNLEERINTVVASITEQGKMSEELQKAIDNVKTMSELEDIYRPYKPKRKTRASIAKEKGLQPLADLIITGKKPTDFSTLLSTYISEEKGVKSAEEALNGALDIIAEAISDEAKYRRYIKDFIFNNAMISSKEIEKDEKDTFGQYANHSERLNKIPNHRVLAISRGEAKKFLKVSLDYDLEVIKERIGSDYLINNDFKQEITLAIADSLKRLIIPSVENEIRNELFEKAEDASLIVFKKNLSALLLYPPLKNKTILGFDPGFRTGCKYAIVSENGVPSLTGVVYITASSQAQVESAKRELIMLLKKYTIDYIALGNGTASRESEEILSQIIKENNFKTKLFIVNESGASVYSASKLAEEEFPELTVEKRSAISLARRVQDPLNELVKIDPKAIGVGQYQHDMNQSKLTNVLHGVVEDCVNSVGVNLNNASVSILNYVAGISKAISSNIYEYIKVNGPFKSRSELKKVPKLGGKTFEQCAGFLRIYGGSEPLDTSAIHPESYKIAKQILKDAKIDLLKNTTEEKEALLAKLNINSLSKEYSVGEQTLNDILEEIKRPGRDIRESVQIIELDNNVKDIKDLKEGMILNGTVRNIMDFGMFIDINVHQDGLVHISEVANKYVSDISSLYTVNDIVKVKVISVDVNKKRIGLSIKQVTN